MLRATPDGRFLCRVTSVCLNAAYPPTSCSVWVSAVGRWRQNESSLNFRLHHHEDEFSALTRTHETTALPDNDQLQSHHKFIVLMQVSGTCMISVSSSFHFHRTLSRLTLTVTFPQQRRSNGGSTSGLVVTARCELGGGQF